jgi:hypothetical protein
MKPKDECAEHHLWHKNLTVAFWLFLSLAYVFILVANSFEQAIIAIAASLILFGARLRIDRKHYEWHVSQDKGEPNA